MSTGPPPYVEEVRRAHQPSSGIYPIVYTVRNNVVVPRVPFQDKVLTPEIIQCIRMNKYTLQHLWTSTWLRVHRHTYFIEIPKEMPTVVANGLHLLVDCLEEGMFMDDETLRDSITRRVKPHLPYGFDHIDVISWEDVDALLKCDNFQLVRRIGLPKVRLERTISQFGQLQLQTEDGIVAGIDSVGLDEGQFNRGA